MEGEAALLDWTSSDKNLGIRLTKSPEGYLVFDSWPGGSRLISKTKMKPGVWFHLAVAKNEQEVALYVNGQKEASGAPPFRFAEDVGDLFLGALNNTQSRFHGLLDEVAFYGKALNASELKSIYGRREAAPCKP